MKILLLGHTGFVGHKLWYELAKIAEVKTAARSSGQFQIDFRDSSRFSGVFGNEHYDVVVSSFVCYPSDEKEILNNSECTKNIIEYFHNKCEQLILISSVSADYNNRFESIYNFSKYLEGELINYYINQRFNIASLRFCQIIDHDGSSKVNQRGFHFIIDSINNNKDFNLFVKNDQPRSYISIEAVCNAIIYAINNSIIGIHNVILEPLLSLVELTNLLLNEKKTYNAEITYVDKEALHYVIPKASDLFNNFIKTNNMINYIRAFVHD